MKRLYRDSSNKMICGVCSGIANFLGIDVSIVRLVWAGGCLLAGTGILLYIIAAVIIPEE